jgi:hypothetical protein
MNIVYFFSEGLLKLMAQINLIGKGIIPKKIRFITQYVENKTLFTHEGGQPKSFFWPKTFFFGF